MSCRSKCSGEMAAYRAPITGRFWAPTDKSKLHTDQELSDMACGYITQYS